MTDASRERSVYIDPLSDFGFKKVFGQSHNADVLKDFLNAILRLGNPIVEIALITTEQLGDAKEDRKAVFDIHCKDGDGNYFIIEVQKLKEEFFIDRSLYYSTFPIRMQAERGKWSFELKQTYTICLLDFCFDDSPPGESFHEVKLVEIHTQRIFSDRLTLVYIELPKFKRSEDELLTRCDHWLYVLTNLSLLKQIPLFLSNDRIFKQFFMDARKAHLTELELWAYYRSKMAEWDEYAIRETAIKEGKAQGIQIATSERNIAFVLSLLQNTSYTVEDISKLVGVSLDFVMKVKDTL